MLEPAGDVQPLRANPPELQPEPEPQALPTPDFNGRWVLAETIGMEPFLVALDVGYIKRTVALKVAESLVGKAEQVVSSNASKDPSQASSCKDARSSG